jgi:protoheme IX farnesyltransferase
MSKNSKTSKIVVSAILLSKPGIILSVAFTGYAGMVLGTRGLPGLSVTVVGIITLLLSAAGSAILNNVLDKKIDKQMTRLTKRVEALETLGDNNAMVLSVVMILISVILSALYLNLVNTVLIVAAVISYTVLYTLYLKRSSPFGTILGGIPGALPVLIGYSAVNPYIGLDGLILFTFMMLWQPPHFWALAQRYKDQYKEAGIPVMPVAFGTKYTNILILLYSISLIPLTLLLWLIGITSAYFAIFALIVGLYFEYTIIKSVYDNKSYGMAFATSIIYMLAIMIALVIDIMLHPSLPVENIITLI